MSDPTHVQYWIDGAPATAWPCDDRGLLYGDGVFESIAVLDGHVRSLERHLARLTRGCRALGFEPPADEDLQTDLEAMAPALGVSRRQSLRLTVTRGRGARGYAPPQDPTPARLWALAAWPEAQSEWQAQGLAVTWLDVTLAHQPMLAGIKHLNRLEQILAARALATCGADEGLLCDPHGNVIEAVSANLFIRTGDTLVTPDVARCGVGGVAREHVLEMAPALGYDVQVAPLRRGDVVAADEVFLTNALRGARPVASLDGVRWRGFAAARAVHGVLCGEVLLP